MHLLIRNCIVRACGHHGGSLFTVCLGAELSVGTKPEESDDSLYYDYPGERPTKLVVQVALVEIWCLAVVDGAKQQAKSIQEKESDLPHEQCEALGARDT